MRTNVKKEYEYFIEPNARKYHILQWDFQDANHSEPYIQAYCGKFFFKNRKGYSFTSSEPKEDDICFTCIKKLAELPVEVEIKDLHCPKCGLAAYVKIEHALMHRDKSDDKIWGWDTRFECKKCKTTYNLWIYPNYEEDMGMQ